MKEEAKKVSLFPIGIENPYGEFFTGQSYLAILSGTLGGTMR